MKYWIALLLFTIIQNGHAQKQLSILQCEELFVKNNLLLVAEQLNVSAAQAAVLQAQIWELPYLSAELNAFNPDAPRFLDVGHAGQKVMAVQQLIYLGGKRKNEIELARSSSEAAMLQLEDLLRNLRYELKRSYYTLYFKKSEISITDKQIANLDTLISSYRVQAVRGNIPMKDLVRLQALFFDLKNQRTELIGLFIEEKEKMKLLTGSFEEFTPDIGNYLSTCGAIRPDAFSADTLLAIALEHRPDFLLAQKNIQVSEWNVRWQKSLAVPDLTLGLAYDQRGGAFNNQTNVTLGIPLALWNRNKGNIRFAESRYKQSQALKTFAADQVRTEVNTALQKWQEASSNYNYLLRSNSGAFEEVYDGVVKNFRRKNISIIEFSDFMESYNQSMMHFNEIKRNLVLSSEDLNRSVHSNLIK